jgi:hypothetical protein
VAPLDEALDEALVKGLPEDSDHVIEARELKARIESILLLQSDLQAALDSTDGSASTAVKRLKKLLDKADDLGLVSGIVKTAKTKLRDLERSMFADSLNGQFDDEAGDEEEDIEELERARKELFSKASQAKYFWTKFHRILSPDAFASGVLFGKSKVKAQQLVWQGSTLHRPVTDIPKPLFKSASTIHKSLLGYCGEKSMSFVPTLAAVILEKGLEEPLLVDEIYCQILKHLTKNPRQDSILSAWQLMCMCVGTFPPSRDFEYYLLNFLLAHRDGSGQVGNYARYAVRRLEGTLQSGPSGYVPSPEDIAAFKDRPPILATIELVDGNIVTDDLPITPDIPVGKVVEICSTFLDLKDPRRGSMGIFVYDVDPDDEDELTLNPLADGDGSDDDETPKKTPHPLPNDSFLGDIVTVRVRQNQPFKFVFKRKIFLDNGSGSEDEVWNNLHYIQMVDDVVQGHVPVDEGEDGTKDASHVARTIAAIFAVDYAEAILAGEYDGDGAQSLEDSIRAAILAEGLEYYLPPRYRRDAAMIADHVVKELLSVPDGADAPLINAPTDDLVDVVHAAVVDHPMFGTCFFNVRKKSFPPSMGAAFPMSIRVGLNAQGLHFIDPLSDETLASYGYASIYRWGGSSTQFTLYLFNDEEDNVEEVSVFTAQAPDMASLILDYIKEIMAHSGD